MKYDALARQNAMKSNLYDYNIRSFNYLKLNDRIDFFIFVLQTNEDICMQNSEKLINEYNILVNLHYNDHIFPSPSPYVKSFLDEERSSLKNISLEKSLFKDGEVYIFKVYLKRASSYFIRLGCTKELFVEYFKSELDRVYISNQIDKSVQKNANLKRRKM